VRLRQLAELGGKSGRLTGHISGDLLVAGRLHLDHVAVVHGPPVVILEPRPSPEVVHVHDPGADTITVGVQRVDRHVQIALVLSDLRGVLLLNGALLHVRAHLLRHFVTALHLIVRVVPLHSSDSRRPDSTVPLVFKK
jgi:hypothetical protein